MMHDLLHLSWLRWRHTRGRAVYWAALAAADLESGSRLEQAYVVYLALMLLAWFVAMSAAAVDGAHGLGRGVGPLALDALHALALVTPGLLVAVLGTRSLRSSPVRLTFPDIAYVGGSALDLRAVGVSSFLREAAPFALAASAIGYLAGWVAVGGGAPATAPLSLSVALLFLAPTTLALAWTAGIARVRVGHSPWPRQSWALAPLAGGVLLLLPESIRWPAIVLTDALGTGLDATEITVLIAGLAVSVWAVTVMSGAMDMTAVFGESALYAELQVFRPLQMYDPTAYADIVRRKQLSRRRPRWQLPEGRGRRALVSRALLSHVRQPSSLVWPVLWGVAILPFVAMTAMSPPGFLASFPAVFAFIAAPSGRLVHVFEQDIDRPSLRSILPYDNLSLLLLGSLPAVILAVTSSAITIVAFGGGIFRILLGVALCAILGMLVVLCAGLELVTLPRMRAPIGRVASGAASLGLLLVAGSTGSWCAACGGGLAAIAVLAVLIRTSVS